MTGSSMPRVTVVMAVYNAAPFLREAVASVLAQTYPDFELIAVDDRSTDGSLEILESFSDPRLRILRHEANQGA
ncbi:MAG TPA: glycosyltransferase family 2 protein, partial [Terracidiphilus sp.]|nr:glycosyltransferase family 2 protein [Terracidiphilus sp.]